MPPSKLSQTKFRRTTALPPAGWPPRVGKSAAAKHSGHVGRRGAIVLPSPVRKRYGLEDGSLFISEERDDGILIRPAMATPLDLAELKSKIREGLDELDQGKGIPEEQAEAELRAVSKAFRARKPQ